MKGGFINVFMHSYGVVKLICLKHYAEYLYLITKNCSSGQIADRDCKYASTFSFCLLMWSSWSKE